MYYKLMKECAENIFILDGIFKSGMVFQRYRKNLIRGHVNNSDFIHAMLDGKSLETRLNGDLFEVVVPPPPAGTNHTIILSTADSSLELTNLCFGDVPPKISRMLIGSQLYGHMHVGSARQVSFLPAVCRLMTMCPLAWFLMPKAVPILKHGSPKVL